MKEILPNSSATRCRISAILLFLFPAVYSFSQATAPLKFGNSYVNVSKKTIGGPVEPGDTLEIRTNFYVNGSYNGTGMMYKVRYYDNLPSHTDTVSNDSLRLITNEGLHFRAYSLKSGDDAGTFIKAPALPGDYQVRINLGGSPVAANPTAPGGIDFMGLSNTAGASNLQGAVNKPIFSSGTIVCTYFRVRVTGTYGDTIVLGAGKIVYRSTATATTDTILNATQYKILIQRPSSLCSSTAGTNFAAEYGGTFGHGIGRNRSTPPSYLIPSYTYLSNSGTSPTINDGYYGIVNNVSPVSSTFPNAYRTPACAGGTGQFSCSNREFNGYWFICGDHTGSTTAAGNPPPDNNTDAGYMLLVNADLATSEAYHQQISGLCPNTYYQFSVWVKNVCPTCGIDSFGHATYLPGVLPNLTLVVDSIDRISSGQIDTVGWQQRGFILLTGPNQRSITISVRNNAPGGGGNDWALDDITLASCPPELTLTPNKPDTLCQGSDDTVKFKISAYVDNYTHFRLEKSTNGGITWVGAGIDTLGRKDTGTVVPIYVPATGQYIDTVTRYFRIAPNEDTIIYRLTVASTVENLSDAGCSYVTAQPKRVFGVNCSIALPTTLLSFRGQLQNGFGNLQWTSANEVPGVVYSVERSDDGKHFRLVGVLPGVADQGQGSVYRFTDPNPVTAESYYRINMTVNSMSRYSNLVLLNNQEFLFEVLSVQNPFSDHIHLQFTAPGQGLATINLRDMFGRPIRKMQQSIVQGLNDLSIGGLSGLPQGAYVLQMVYNGQVISTKLLKMGR
jgi:hypothetical protein